MNGIKSAGLFLVSCVFCYGLLIVGDWVVEEVRSGELSLSEPQLLEEKRRIEEDEPQKKLALQDGFTSTIYPYFFGRVTTLKQRAEQLGIAPVGGRPNTPTYYCNEGYGLIRYMSDRFGLRNEDEKWNRDIDTLFIGDSYVHGACVKDDQTIPSVYQNLTGQNSINLGFSGNNPYIYAALSKIFIPVAKPKNVVLVFYSNDYGKLTPQPLFDFVVNQNSPYLPVNDASIIDIPPEYGKLFEGVEAQVETKKQATDWASKSVSTLRRHSTLPSISGLIHEQISGASTDDFRPSKIAIDLNQELCQLHDCALKVVYIPNSNYWRPDYRADNYGKLLKSYTAEKSVEFIDTTAYLDRGPESPDFAMYGPHLSPMGYSKVSRLIADTNYE